MTTTKKRQHLSTELFAGRDIPEFISQHAVFKTPNKVQKVFPSIGMPNYSEKANLDKCLADIKKDGSYVMNLIRLMHDTLGQYKVGLAEQYDAFQFLMSPKERAEKKGAFDNLGDAVGILTSLQQCLNVGDKAAINEVVKTEGGQISLTVPRDIMLANGKPAHRKGERLMRAITKINERVAELGVTPVQFDQTEQFKIFSKENIPNKEFSIRFSSEGPEGAFDIVTMSMRGITSCQRWEGEYHRCLIGSVLSKFVGIIYLTSGVMNDGTKENGGRANLGPKMMRRCMVRYAINADEDKPCIVIDKMYPDLDQDILKAFKESIAARTNLEVIYAQDPQNKLRHIYIPSEEMREKVLEREWSYQDTPLKSKHDLYAILLNFNKDEVERELKGFRVNLGLFIARRFEEIYSGNISVSPEVKKVVMNLRMNTSFTPVCEQFVDTIMRGFRPPASNEFSQSRVYYRRYLMDFLKHRRAIHTASQSALQQTMLANVTRPFTGTELVDYVFAAALDFARSEIRRSAS